MAREKTPNGIEYESELAGSSGARYYLVVDKGAHTEAEIKTAKRYIRDNFDAVTVTVEHNVYKKKKVNNKKRKK